MTAKKFKWEGDGKTYELNGKTVEDGYWVDEDGNMTAICDILAMVDAPGLEVNPEERTITVRQVPPVKTWEDSADGRFVILYNGEKTYEVSADKVRSVKSGGQRINYEIGNAQLLRKMRGEYGNPKGCRTGIAPKPKNDS